MNWMVYNGMYYPEPFLSFELFILLEILTICLETVAILIFAGNFYEKTDQGYEKMSFGKAFLLGVLVNVVSMVLSVPVWMALT